ncbi:BRO1 [Gracilaria domingensis]|nr:BRO1 [Gracilaria domingensis]
MAAGYFRHAAQLPTPGGVRNVTNDLYPVTLSALEMIMLGNAQQVFYQITLEARTASPILARFAVGARDFYANAHETCLDPDVANTRINAYVGKPAAALAAYYDAVAQSCQANAHHDSYEMAEQLAHLAHAQRLSSQSLKAVNALDTSSLATTAKFRDELLADITALSSDLAVRKEEAEDENRKVYFQSPASTLTPIQSRQSVKPADVLQIITEQPMDERLQPFGELPPPISVEQNSLVSQYTDMVAHDVASVAASVNTSAADLRDLINRSEQVIEASREKAVAMARQSAPSQNESHESDEKAIEMVQETQQSGGVRTLRELQVQVINMAGDVKTQVNHIESMLHAEETEDRRFRGSMPTIMRPTSSEMTHTYRSRLAKLQTNLRQAANADAIVTSQIEKHSQAIADLEQLSLEGLKTSPASFHATQSANLSAHVEAMAERMQTEISEGKRMLSQKDDILQAMEKKKALETPQEVLATVPDDELDLERLQVLVDREFGSMKRNALSLRADMISACEVLGNSIAKLQQPRQEDDERMKAQERMKEVYKVQAAAFKFKEISGHLQEGAKFYAKEQDNLARLAEDVKGYVAARRDEVDQLVRQHQADLASRQGFYPSTSNPYNSGVSQYSRPPYPGNSNSTQSHPYGSQQHPYSGSQSAWGRQ